MLAFQLTLDALSPQLNKLGVTPTEWAAGSQLASRFERMAVRYNAAQHLVATAGAVTRAGL
jgi:hypothetical protein